VRFVQVLKRERKLIFQGLKFHISDECKQPPRKVLKNIIKSGGGKVMKTIDGKNCIEIIPDETSSENVGNSEPNALNGAQIPTHTAEAVIDLILQQKELL
jgi:hypothetical protein